METIASLIATVWGWFKAAAFAVVALFAAEPPQGAFQRYAVAQHGGELDALTRTRGSPWAHRLRGAQGGG